MRFTEWVRALGVGRWARRAALPVSAAVAACSPAPVPAPAGADRTSPAVPGEPAVASPNAATAAPLPKRLEPPVAARTWDEFKRQAARRLVLANADIAYDGPVPDPLLAIPVLEIELNGDGSIRHIGVLRHPRQAADTTQTAIAAVRRAAPYGDMRHLKRPWKFVETFLFDDERRFKPRTLDE